MTRFILVVLGMFIVATSYFLSRFIIRRILAPLKELERGAEEVRKGNLSVHLDYERNDEFSPAIETFNVMAWRLKRSLEEKEEDEQKRKELIASIPMIYVRPLRLSSLCGRASGPCGFHAGHAGAVSPGHPQKGGCIGKAGGAAAASDENGYW